MRAEFVPTPQFVGPTHKNDEPVLAKTTNKNLFFVGKIL